MTDKNTVPVYIYKYDVAKGVLNMICVEKYIHEKITYDKASYYGPGIYRVILHSEDKDKAIRLIKDDIESTITNLRKIETQLDKLSNEE